MVISDNILKSLTRNNGRKYTLKDNKDKFFFPDEYGRFEDALKSKQKHSVKCLINTGARINELLHVRKEDCDLDNRRITLRVTKTKSKKGEKHGKTRIIPISTQFAKYLKSYFKDKKDEDYLGLLSNAALNQAYKKAGQKAQIKDYWNISSHTFRKTLEVWLMALGIGDLTITAHLGHDIRTAASNYVSPNIFSWDDKTKFRLIIGDLYSN